MVRVRNNASREGGRTEKSTVSWSVLLHVEYDGTPGCFNKLCITFLFGYQWCFPSLISTMFFVRTLWEGVMLPVSSDVWGAVIQHHVYFPRLQLFPESLKDWDISITNKLQQNNLEACVWVWYTTDTCLHFSVVMSSCRVTTLGMGLMGTKSTPDHEERGKCKQWWHKNKKPSKQPTESYISQWLLDLPMIRLDTGMNLDATCNLYGEKVMEMWEMSTLHSEFDA